MKISIVRLNLFLALASLPCWSQAASGGDDRLYRFLIQQNKAQVVGLAEGKLITASLAGQLARALRDVDAANRAGGIAVSANYLDLEAQLVKKMGAEASKIHMGRSRNDLGATSERLIMREDALELLTLMADARQSLLTLAEKNVHTIIPAFTPRRAGTADFARALSVSVHFFARTR